MDIKKRPLLSIVWVIILLSGLTCGVAPKAVIIPQETNQPSAVSGPSVDFLPSIYNSYPLPNLFGVTVYHIDAANGLNELAAANTNWTRTGVNWEAIQPVENGSYIWDPTFDQEILNAAKSHIQPVLIISGAPSWALKEGFTPCGPIGANHVSELGQFASDLVKRYSVPPYNVKYWELYNEPDVSGSLGCWGDPSDTQYYGGEYYGQMLQIVYPMMKAASPNIQVMVGGLLLNCDPTAPPVNDTCIPAKFLEGILVSGAGGDFDGVSFHAYDYYGAGKGMYSNSNWHSAWNTTGPVSLAKAKFIRTVLANYGQNQKFLMATETALFYGPNTLSSTCQVGAPPDLEVTKAYYLVESYASSAADGLIANIWYSAFGVRCSGLLDANLLPLPAYNAYKFAAQMLTGAVFVRSVTVETQFMGYEYSVFGHSLWILWSLDGNSHTITLPSTPILVNHIGDDGNPVPETNSITLSIDISPRFIEFTK